LEKAIQRKLLTNCGKNLAIKMKNNIILKKLALQEKEWKK